MTDRGVGQPSDDIDGACTFSARPDGLTCGEPAAVHVMVDSPQWDIVSLAACAAHATVARVAGRFVDEHPYGGVCRLPGSVWLFDEKRCAIDDTGEEPAPCGELALVVPGVEQR